MTAVAEKKRRKVVHPTASIAHLWAHQTQSEARNPQSNFYFRDSMLFSYRDSFMVARLVTRKGSKAALVTDDYYSSTTSGHIQAALRAIPPGTHVFRVWDPRYDDHQRNLRDYQHKIDDAAAAASTARLYFDIAVRKLRLLVDEANSYARFFGLKIRFTQPEIDTAAGRERARRAEATKRKRDETNRVKWEKQRREMEERSRLNRLKAEERLALWLAGNNVDPPRDGPVKLRVRGSRIETSMGAIFPLKDALALLPAIRSGVPYRRVDYSNTTAVDEYKLGDFYVDCIEAEGHVRAGCHVVTRQEIERLAATLTQETA